MPTQAEKARIFEELHAAPGTFVIANAWDGGTARMFQHLGYPALTTSSGAQAATLGRRDGRVTRDEALAHCRAIVAATDLPVAADLEKGFGHDPSTCAETIRMAADAGLVGGSIEDATGDPRQPLYAFDDAVARVAAAAEAARSLPFKFMFVARAENFLRGNPDLDDTICRLNAFADAGADVLFAPGLPTIDAVRTVCQSVSKPFNFMAGIPGRSFTVAELAAAGVKRISLAGSIHRAAMTAAHAAAREVLDHGTFTYLDTSIPTAEFSKFLA